MLPCFILSLFLCMDINKVKSFFDTHNIVLLSEEQNMLNNGYVRQYDCGNYVFVWKNEVKGSK